jgi:hypothetical protein
VCKEAGGNMAIYIVEIDQARAFVFERDATETNG